MVPQPDNIVAQKGVDFQNFWCAYLQYITSAPNIVAQKEAEVDFPNFWCSDLQYITSADLDRTLFILLLLLPTLAHQSKRNSKVYKLLFIWFSFIFHFHFQYDKLLYNYKTLHNFVKEY